MGLDEIKDKLTGGGADGTAEGTGGGITERISDAGIEKGGDMVEDKTGGKGAAFIDKGETFADGKIGE